MYNALVVFERKTFKGVGNRFAGCSTFL